MAAFTPNDFPIPVAEEDTYANRVSNSPFAYPGTSPQLGGSFGPVPYCTRYAPSGSVAFLYIQTDRVLITSGALTTTSNYIVTGTSAPTVTAVTFTTGKKYIKLTLSGILTLGAVYTLTVKENVFGDGQNGVFNIASPIPIFINLTPTQSGVAETINVGSPVMSHT